MDIDLGWWNRRGCGLRWGWGLDHETNERYDVLFAVDAREDLT